MDQPTIQAAIEAAVPGDEVLVAPGTYLEQIDFLGKSIVVRSAAGPGVTTIDGGASFAALGSMRATAATFSTVSFVSGEARDAILEGFTIRNGYGSPFGGGVRISNASPTIRGNVIRDNRSCKEGAGIGAELGSRATFSWRSAAGRRCGALGRPRIDRRLRTTTWWVRRPIPVAPTRPASTATFPWTRNSWTPRAVTITCGLDRR